MAKFRRLHAAEGLDFDWRPREDGRQGSRALLENGDWAEVGLHIPHNGPRSEVWEYHLLGPAVPHDELSKYSGSSRLTPSLGGPGTGHPILGQATGVNGLDDHEGAMAAAEAHYKGLGRRGQAPSGIDSGVDYSDLNQFMDEL